MHVEIGGFVCEAVLVVRRRTMRNAAERLGASRCAGVGSLRRIPLLALAFAVASEVRDLEKSNRLPIDGRAEVIFPDREFWGILGNPSRTQPLIFTAARLQSAQVDSASSCQRATVRTIKRAQQ